MNETTEIKTWDKAYSPKDVEARWVNHWAQSGIFNSHPDLNQEPYSLVIPPPNVTGALHVGHALNNTIQDFLARLKRMSGKDLCWVPGTDHGGIATQTVMEKILKAENTSRVRIGREAFTQRMEDWTLHCKETILGQLKKLGCSLDFSRESFTMDEKRKAAVFEAFKKLWDDGLLYRGERLVNWCVRCGTALSDIEVEHEERKGNLWHIRYPEASGGPGLVVATTRPETMLGDVAVAVYPEDKRYRSLIGKKLRLPLVNREIPVIEDGFVESSFGTGAVKVTPAHDPNDFEMGLRHQLPRIKVISPSGKITEEGGLYAGLSREDARKKIIQDLEFQGFLEKTETHPHAVGICYRCQEIIEPLLSWQWFVKTKDLAAGALKTLENNQFKIYPASWKEPYRNWLLDIRDWCVSRQIWWGHEIPVWYCLKCNAISKDSSFHQIPNLRGVVSREKPKACSVCGHLELIQDPDVLDTWFSSALWPFSVFGWPEKNQDLQRYYPTQILVTGYEIIYLWVARMQMMGLYLTGKVPFSEAFIHGIVRDKKGKKMSKSLGNVIDPIEMMDKYGTDALRFSLISQARPGKDILFSEDSLIAGRNFTNKLWNTARFALMNAVAPEELGTVPNFQLEAADVWILSEYQKMILSVQEEIEIYNLANATEKMYEFLWDEFCDWYVEIAKLRLQGADLRAKKTAFRVLITVLNGVVKMLHPLMPFVTEEIYSVLKTWDTEPADFLMNSRFPNVPEIKITEETQKGMSALIEAVKSLRSLRAQLGISPGLKIPVICQSEDAAETNFLKENLLYLAALAGGREISFLSSKRESLPTKAASTVTPHFTFYVPLEGLIDFKKESERLKKELGKVENDLGKLSQKLSDPNYLSKAAMEEVSETRFLQDTALSKKARLEELIKVLA